uniref:E3_UbLigase_R4 domain-containing protein n=1 Tax=Caenorhabditis tropicalis TaxID=1561998 RepID=A0A1I7UEM6_9PELO
MILEKLTRAKSSSTWQNISDSPSYNLSRVLASCMTICDPKVIGAHFSRLIKLIKYDANLIYPFSENSYANYSLLRSVELLLSVCLEKRGEERKENAEMLDSIVEELQNVGIRDLCFQVLEKVIPEWKERGPSTFTRSSADHRKVWLPHVPLVSSSANPPNAAIMNWPSNSSDAYIISCTDLVLLIPQHLQELDRRKTVPRDDRWIQKLCQLSTLSAGCSAYRQCKKLLLAMCNGDEAKYKIMKDKYKMQDLLQQLVQKYMDVSKQVGGHQQLTDIVDILASITKLALSRPDMWRDVCSTYTTWLLRLACYTTDVVASQVVELLIVAVRDSSVGGQLSIQLADSIIEAQNGEFIEKIIKRFLIGKDEHLRWTLHGMLRSVIQLASRQNQCSIVKKLYSTVYPMVENLGIQGAQLVDLIATYAPRVFSSSELVSMTQSEISTIQRLGEALDNEGYQGMYKQMIELGLGWKSIQFDRNPCLVCFTSKGSHDVVKMSSIKSDTRFSANTIIYKLISNYEISKVTIKLTEVKKNKSIKKVSLYYSAKSVESVELKLHPELWRKCAVVNVADNETTINLSLAVPVVTSSLIIDFEEVSDQRGTNQLHCPRCSGTVRTHGGVCESCGENAFQCMKCRAINYVEKEPFLCQSCGYCKYARIEMFAVCRALPGAQHITCDAERGQCIQEISQLLTKMETTKTKLTGYRAVCESLYLKSRPLPHYKLHVENSHTSEFFEANGTMNVDQLAFQTITQPMNNLAASIRTLHSELCQQTQQLMYLHEELNRYDHASEVSVVFHKPQNTSYYSTSETCFGCLCNQLLHSIALLHSSCDDENALNIILSSDFVIEKLGILGQTYETLREEIEELLVRLMFGRTDITTKIGKFIENGDVNLSVMVKSLMYAADPTWQQKLKLLIRFAIEKKDENSCLQALMVLNKYLEATKSVSLDEKKKMKITSKRSVVKWLTSEDEWKDCCSLPSTSTAPTPPTPSNPYQWISECLFSQWMSVRSAANHLLINLSRQQFHEPIALLILCENLSKLTDTSSSICDQFMSSCHTIIDSSVNTKTRLFIQQFHVYLIRRIHEECANLHQKSISLLSDNTFGERLRCFVELLSLLLSGSNVENVLLKAGADDLLIFLLHSTIFLKRMMTRRTRAVDSSRMALEKLLKRVSCRDGTKLMTVCVESLKLVKDTSTLGIIVGVMMEIMNPQQETEESFLIQMEKDVAQEDFLQGRMANPYNSNDPGMGPLMRDIKNKICRDTEMIALMEDDNGMELLVNGNIISLSLSVREVYDRLWKRNNSGAPMLIVYRMRGLMGDAVETFIESFGVAENSGDDEQVDEQLVKMTNCLIQCGGIDKLMDLLETDVSSSSGRFLLAHLRKIFERIVKTPSGRKALIERRMVERMMSVVRTCCEDPTNESKVLIGMELYKVIEFVVTDKNVEEILSGIREEDATWWFDMFEKRGNEEGSVTELHRKTAQIIDQMAGNIGNIVLGSDASENVLVKMYFRILKWDVLDAGVLASDHQARHHRTSRRDQTIMMTEQLANITSNILPSKYGIRLKQKVLDSGVIATTCQYLMKDLPNLYQPTESPEWKAFLSKPSLKLILTLLSGLARGHQASQKEIAKTTLKLLHRLEQVASDNSIGTLAENVIEALNEDEEVRNQIKMVRDETEKKKKQMAMMNREKQLQKMRMKVSSGGQITVSSRTLHNEPSIDETDSLTCCICRESVIRETQSSGVYAFAAIDQESAKTSTVSMMVMVHLDCHKGAIRGGGGGRATDEWTRSKLHNAGAKCNVITPIATGTTSEEAWMEVVHRFETDIGRVSGLAHGIVNRNFVFVDICKLVDRFIYKRSFSNQSDGGGRESNMQYLAILHLLGISLPADEAELEISAPNHRLVAFLFTELTADSWNDQKNDVLRAGLNDAQTNGVEATWQGFKPTLLTWAFVDSYFNNVIKITGEDRLEWLREHLVETIHKTLKFVQDFDTNVLPCEDAAEFCDVTGASLEDVNMFINRQQ